IPPTFLTSDAQHIELADEIAEYDGTVAGCIEFRNRSVKLASTGYQQGIHRQNRRSFSRHEGVEYPVLVESQQECPPFY
ncbi:MAG: hypothetical protein WBC72_21830, partial [Pseudolabrys sp.]